MRTWKLVAVLLLAILASVGSYFAFTKVWQPWEKENDARKQLAFVSIADRLPKGKPITPSKPLDAEARKRWQEVEDGHDRSQRYRAELLQALHEKTRRFFVESPGAGSGRGIPIMPEDILMDNWGGWGLVQQPGEPAEFPASAGEALNRVPPGDEFHSFHMTGMHNFLVPSKFGYVKDRQHVAGFTPHGFRYLSPDLRENKKWRVDHVQLIGVLTQEQPVVYLTDKMPSMEQIRQDKTRSLDFFEEAALPSLRAGEDLYIVSKGDTLRMLGALRATKTCQKCHDAEIGDLLGAFSYTLRPAPKAKDADSRTEP